ncbi:bifunctional phosphopantothenoylcysteine decarboxylase/phosphopantothenate--cysteine ligase CoaBC [Agaribacter marinus]|uniref:Coenzyme A biosynthesis bifunctional protein CoaBC n=1 Tax=Agaribacter marinus TaxID=1431249 RepID=A0AA37WFM5_9ALTE|nr:bifunctional phosphopantothenoylcysteine decarboxylase/phosphopantothenate--cysteine ligase CoaBC [Agaribacter marinus]GLR69106.1 phosphopantothenoylcysteine decarboxylase [Agaribacter marinus]
MQLEQKNVLLGISGGIAAYKTPDLVRKLKAQGANVRVVITESASHFVSTLSLQAVSGEKVSTHLLDEQAELGMGHIELARWADIFLIAPTTANTIAKLAHGLADDLLTTLALATKAPMLLAPAMNQQMWAAQATIHNVQTLADRGAVLLGPAAGEQACGDVGFGRMLEPEEIVTALDSFVALNMACSPITPAQNISKNALLSGKRIMITAGPTREAIDPVRYISNHSSGKMGYAIAKAAVELGAKVTLVSGPVNILPPENVEVESVVSAQQMYDAVMSDIGSHDIFIACAAVADYRVDNASNHKMKKNKDDGLTLSFIQNPDILKSVAALDTAPFTVGFAAETQDMIEYAKSKLIRKKLNMIAANDVSKPGLGFNSDKNALIVITPEKEYELAQASKDSLAVNLLRLVEREYQETQK